MCNYQFTEKQVNNFIKRNKYKKGWLSARDVRSENMPSLETRKLMQLMCDNLKFAFDNQVVFQDERYQICFELDQKDRMIEELDRFDRLVLDHPAIMDIPSRSIIINRTIPSDFLNWCGLSRDFAMVLTAFRRYQNGQSIEDFQYFAHSDSIYYAARKLLLKDAKEHLLIKVRDFISMYKALRIGWKEIKHFCPNGTYNTFFIAILKEYYNNTFMRSLSYSEIPTKKIIHSPKDVTLSNFHGNVKIELERLSKDKYIDDSDRELSILTLGKYNQEPHGQGFKNAFAVLKKLAKKDPQVMQILMDLYQALSIVGRFSEQSIGENFDEFLKRDGIGNFVLNHDPKSDDAFTLDQFLDRIKDVMRASDDPRIRAAVSEWVGATSKILKFDVKISRRNAQKSKKDVDR